jgi:hypothetical protein
MNEQEWLACGDPDRMLHIDLPEASERRRWLFVCACCRLIPGFMSSQPDRQSVEVAERWAEDGFSYEVDFPWGEAFDIRWYRRYVPNATARALETYSDAIWALCYNSGRAHTFDEAKREGDRCLVALIRDIFGNPFRPVALDPAWLTSDVLVLARGIYADQAYDGMPILADALQDAGCTNEDVLNHGRNATATHVRGCWVLDLLLGKA